MMNAPRVLVVARFRSPDEAGRILQCLSRQTYQDTRFVLVERDDKQVIGSFENSLAVCSERGFAAHLESSGADMVLFWPDEGVLKEAAIEKLVLALQVAPDQEGVADIARGSTGFWLARNGKAATCWISLWMESQLRWIEESHRRKVSLFFIPENLSETSDPLSLRRPYVVEHLFVNLPPRFKPYQRITIDPLWTLPAAELDERSVLFLISDLPMGGASKFLLDITGELKTKDHRVTVATTSYGAENPWLEELLKIIPDAFVLSHSRPIELGRLIVHLARTRRCGRVVISNSFQGYQLLPWLRLQLPEVTFLDYTHIEYETEWPDGGYALHSVSNQSLLDMSVVSSEHLRQWMLARGAHEEGLRVCRTNIDTEKWMPNAEARARDRYELGIDRETAVILCPCRLTEQKRPELLCNIIVELRRATKIPFVVLVAGDGPLMTPLRHFVEKHDLENSVRLLGAVSLERVAQLHNASDIFLLPSLVEGIALALFEAMALECVPVVADVGGQSEVVTPECGYLIQAEDSMRELADYMKALKHLLENPDHRRQQAAACRVKVQNHFHLSQMTANFIAVLNEAGQRRSNRSIHLPDAAICRELATSSAEQIRLAQEGIRIKEKFNLLQAQTAKQEKIIQRLQRQIETLRSNLVLEENGIPT